MSRASDGIPGRAFARTYKGLSNHVTEISSTPLDFDDILAITFGTSALLTSIKSKEVELGDPNIFIFLSIIAQLNQRATQESLDEVARMKNEWNKTAALIRQKEELLKQKRENLN